MILALGCFLALLNLLFSIIDGNVSGALGWTAALLLGATLAVSRLAVRLP